MHVAITCKWYNLNLNKQHKNLFIYTYMRSCIMHEQCLYLFKLQEVHYTVYAGSCLEHCKI